MAIRMTSAGTLSATVFNSVQVNQVSEAVTAAALPTLILNGQGGRLSLEADKKEELLNLARQILEVATGAGAR